MIDPQGIAIDDPKRILDAPRPVRWKDLAPGSLLAIVTSDGSHAFLRIFLGMGRDGAAYGYASDCNPVGENVVPLIPESSYVLLWDAADQNSGV